MTTQSKVLIGLGVVVVLALIARAFSSRLMGAEKAPPAPGQEPAEPGVPVNADMSDTTAADQIDTMTDDRGQVSVAATDIDSISDELTRQSGDAVVDALPEPIEEVMWEGLDLLTAATRTMDVPQGPPGAKAVQDAQLAAAGGQSVLAALTEPAPIIE